MKKLLKSLLLHFVFSFLLLSVAQAQIYSFSARYFDLSPSKATDELLLRIALVESLPRSIYQKNPLLTDDAIKATTRYLGSILGIDQVDENTMRQLLTVNAETLKDWLVESIGIQQVLWVKGDIVAISIQGQDRLAGELARELGAAYQDLIMNIISTTISSMGKNENPRDPNYLKFVRELDLARNSLPTRARMAVYQTWGKSAWSVAFPASSNRPHCSIQIPRRFERRVQRFRGAQYIENHGNSNFYNVRLSSFLGSSTDLTDILNVIASTPTGLGLVRNFVTQLNLHHWNFRPLTMKTFFDLGDEGIPKADGITLIADRVVYVDMDQTLGEIALTLAHEITHALDEDLNTEAALAVDRRAIRLINGSNLRNRMMNSEEVLSWILQVPDHMEFLVQASLLGYANSDLRILERLHPEVTQIFHSDSFQHERSAFDIQYQVMMELSANNSCACNLFSSAAKDYYVSDSMIKRVYNLVRAEN